jgi:glycosyltransferase involved in cell wall biosynthesis
MSRPRPLKILHIDPERAWGGGENQVMGLLGFLSLRGHQNHLLCDPEGRLLQEAQKKGVSGFPLRIRNEIDLRAVLFLRRLIRDQRYDIIHYHTKRAHGLALWLGRREPRTKSVVTRRMDYPVRPNWHTRCLYNRCVDGAVAISKKIAELLIEGGVQREKIRVIHSGVDPVPFRKERRRKPISAPRAIGTVAVLEERKGHRFLLEAAALLRQRGCQLRIHFAGDGSWRNELQTMTAQLGLEKEVVFHGFVADIPAFLADIDIFVLPSLYEGLGVAAIEAMAAGKPVIATRAGGLPELVEDGINGFLVPEGDPEMLAESISRLLSREGLIEEMGQKGWERVQRDLTMEQMAKKNEHYYYELLQEDGR